jgi:hypothetical protein
MTGAGDAFFVGFLFGYINGMSIDHSARAGQALACSVMGVPGTHLPNALKAMSKFDPEIADICAFVSTAPQRDNLSVRRRQSAFAPG